VNAKPDGGSLIYQDGLKTMVDIKKYSKREAKIMPLVFLAIRFVRAAF
jgi:hypothetical protein